MALLHEIQSELLDPKSSIGPILLKLRYLAARLGSVSLEDWVKFELEGYPEGASIPDYRHATVTYRGTFSNGVQTLNDVPIPQAMIAKFADPSWTHFEIRDSIAVVDSIVAGDTGEAQKMGVDGGNLMLALNGKVYPGLSPLNITGRFGGSPFNVIHSVVRSRILDLTLTLENEVPIAKDVAIGAPLSGISENVSANITQITNNIFYGPQTNITANGPVGAINVAVVAGDPDSLRTWLINKGVPNAEAGELVEIAVSEVPENDDLPLGKRAKKWLADTLVKGGKSLWGMKEGVIEGLIIEGLKAFYGWA